MVEHTTAISRAARELAMRLFASDHGMSHMDKLPEFETLRLRHQSVVEKYEAIVQSALSELLEKAEAVAGCAFRMHSLSESVGRLEMDRLRKALEPWKVPE